MLCNVGNDINFVNYLLLLGLFLPSLRQKVKDEGDRRSRFRMNSTMMCLKQLPMTHWVPLLPPRNQQGEGIPPTHCCLTTGRQCDANSRQSTRCLIRCMTPRIHWKTPGGGLMRCQVFHSRGDCRWSRCHLAVQVAALWRGTARRHPTGPVSTCAEQEEGAVLRPVCL